MYKTILVPIDLSHIVEGKSTLDIAAEHGGKDTKIVLLNVVEEIPNWAAIELPAGIQDKSVETAQRELKAVANASGLQNVKVDVRVGHSYSTILDTAEDIGAELIIIASHRPGLQDYFLGSTAAKVVRHAKCSVLVVR